MNFFCCVRVSSFGSVLFCTKHAKTLHAIDRKTIWKLSAHEQKVATTTERSLSLYCSVPDPGFSAFLTYGSGMGKNQDPG